MALKIAKKSEKKDDEKDPKKTEGGKPDANKSDKKPQEKEAKGNDKPKSPSPAPKAPAAPQGPPMDAEMAAPMDDAMPMSDMPMEMPMEAPDLGMGMEPNPADGMMPLGEGDLLPQQLVIYMDSIQGPFECASCRYWGGSACTKVENATDPGGLCNLFNPQSQDMDPMMSDESVMNIPDSPDQVPSPMGDVPSEPMV